MIYNNFIKLKMLILFIFLLSILIIYRNKLLKQKKEMIKINNLSEELLISKIKLNNNYYSNKKIINKKINEIILILRKNLRLIIDDNEIINNSINEYISKHKLFKHYFIENYKYP